VITLLLNLFGVLPLILKLVGQVMERREGGPVSVRKVRRRARDLVELAEEEILAEMHRRPEVTVERRKLIALMAAEGVPEDLASPAIYQAARTLRKKAARHSR